MRRRGTAMVAVLVLVLVMAALAAAMLGSARGSRRRTRKAAARVQRELALDAAFVHGFHALKTQGLDPSKPVWELDPATGEGELGEVPYRFRLTPEPSSRSVRIDGEAGQEGGPTMEGYAVAYVDVEEDDRRRQTTWSIRYFGSESPEKLDD